jgi:hypothetical protein
LDKCAALSLSEAGTDPSDRCSSTIKPIQRREQWDLAEALYCG